MDEKKNEIRPPLVGQASTSSNESSIDMHENNSSSDEETKKIGLYTYEPRPRYEGAPTTSESSDKNSNDEIQIITQIPRMGTDRNYPIGCSNVTSADTSLELPDGRIPTPSSVSSVNSKRGLEWDNLGDVGYSNVHSTSLSDPLGEGGGERDSCTIGQDTLERIVSMETERRFDPEGTTESTLGNLPPSGPLPLTPMHPALGINSPALSILNGSKPLHFQLGKPAAESTPNSNNQSNRDYNNGSKKEYNTSNKDYSGSNREYNTSNIDYNASHRDFSGSHKEYSPTNKEHVSSSRIHGSNQDGVSNVFASKGNRNNDATVESSSDNDPVTEYEIKKRQVSGKGDRPSDRRSHKSEAYKGDDRRSQKNGRENQKIYSKHLMERGELVEGYAKDDVETNIVEKMDIKRDDLARKRNSGESSGSGHKRSVRDSNGRDGRRGEKKREEKGERSGGDFEEVLAKYGRGITRREDLGTSSGGQKYLGVQNSHDQNKPTCSNNLQSSSSKISPNKQNLRQERNEQLEVEPTIHGNSASKSETHSKTYKSPTYDISEKPINDGTKRRIPGNNERAHSSGDFGANSSDRIPKSSSFEREGNDERAVDQCRKNNEHIKQIVEKYNESLKQHRQQLRQTDQQYYQHEPKHQHQKYEEQYSQQQQIVKADQQYQQFKQNDHPKNYPQHQLIQEHLEHSQQSKKKPSDTLHVSQKENRLFKSGHQMVSNVPNKSPQGRPPRKPISSEKTAKISGGEEDASFEQTFEESSRDSRPIKNELPGEKDADPYKSRVISSLEGNDNKSGDGGTYKIREKDMRNPLQRVESKSKHRRKYYRLFPHSTEDGCGVRRTNSLEHMLGDEGLKSSSLPRYHSTSSLTLNGPENVRCCDAEFDEGDPHHQVSPPLPPPYSASSSSLSTIITKRADMDGSPQKLSKLSQTSAAVRSSVTTQTMPCTEDGGICTGAHPRTQPTAFSQSHNTSDVEDNLLIRESNPADCKTNCNTLDSIGSEETVGSWVGKTYYNNRKPDGENLEDDPAKYPVRKANPKMQLTQEASPADRCPDGVHGPYNEQSRVVSGPYNEQGRAVNGPYNEHSRTVNDPYNNRLFNEMYTVRDGAYNHELYGRNSDGGRDIDNEPDMEGDGEVDNQDVRLQTGERSDQIDRVNSFEYLPGAVYEQNQATQDSSSDDLEEEEEERYDLDHVIDPNPEVNALSHSGSCSSLSSTLQYDVITGVNFIQDLLAHTRDSKKFIKYFVHTLIKTSPTECAKSRIEINEVYRTQKSTSNNSEKISDKAGGHSEPGKIRNCEQRPSNIVGSKTSEAVRGCDKKKSDDKISDEEFRESRFDSNDDYKRSQPVCNGGQYYGKGDGDCTAKNEKRNGDGHRNKNIESTNVDYDERCNNQFNGNDPDRTQSLNYRRDINENKKNGQCNRRSKEMNLPNREHFIDEHRKRNIDGKDRYEKEIDNQFDKDPNTRYRKEHGENNRYEKAIEDKSRYRNKILHQNVPFTPVNTGGGSRGNHSRDENISGESATKSSMGMLSDVTPERDSREEKDGEHTTSSDFFKPSPKAFNLQPSILYARAHSTTLTSEDDSHLQSLPQHAQKNKPRPLSPPTQQRPPRTCTNSQTSGQYAPQPPDSRSEEETVAVSKQEMALQRLYEKQKQASRNRANPANSGENPNSNRAANTGVQIKSILTNRKREPVLDTSPTLSSSHSPHPSPPSPAPASKGGEANSDDCNWRSPVTESEKLYAMRQRAGVVQPTGKSSDGCTNDTLVGYLQLERQNQLDWIKAEIDHLNNLKDLLEKQETLKRSLSAYKQTRRVRKTLSKASSSIQPQPTPCLSSSSEPGCSNPRTSGPESTAQPLVLRRVVGGVDTVKGDSKAAEQDEASIYAHKIDKERNNKEERGRLLLPCEYRRKRAVIPPSTLKLKHNMNEMMTRSVQTLQLDKQAKSKSSRVSEATASGVAARPKTTAKVVESTAKSIESTAIQTSDSILNLPHWLHQPESVQPSVPQDKSSQSQLQPGPAGSDKENTVCPCLAALVNRLGEDGVGRELERRRCKCYGGERKEGKSRKATPPSVGYVITFEPLAKKSKKLKPRTVESVAKSSSNGCTSSDTDVTTKPRSKSLQEYLEENRPDYVSKAEVRRQCLAEKSYLREQQDTTQHKQKILLAALKHGGSESEDHAKPKGPGVRKIFTTRELRTLTRRKYQNLPEVQMKKIDAKRKEDYRTNKLMAEVFTRKLQRKALKGVVDLSNSDQVLGQMS